MFGCAQYCQKSMCYLNQLIIVIVYDEIFRTKLYLRPLFINKRFVLNKMFQQNASKFAIFYV